MNRYIGNTTLTYYYLRMLDKTVRGYGFLQLLEKPSWNGSENLRNLITNRRRSAGGERKLKNAIPKWDKLKNLNCQKVKNLLKKNMRIYFWVSLRFNLWQASKLLMGRSNSQLPYSLAPELLPSTSNCTNRFSCERLVSVPHI